MTNEDQLITRLKALADPNRLRIIALLKQTGCCSIGTTKDKGLCACDIESRVPLSQPTISHHMRILREAGLIEAEKIGPWMWYRRNEQVLQGLAHTLSRQL